MKNHLRKSFVIFGTIALVLIGTTAYFESSHRGNIAPKSIQPWWKDYSLPLPKSGAVKVPNEVLIEAGILNDLTCVFEGKSYSKNDFFTYLRERKKHLAQEGKTLFVIGHAGPGLDMMSASTAFNPIVGSKNFMFKSKAED
ncbi:MAG: hypothetical protein K9N47_03440 [Prosthecobacter sp.]|uniref:hypothetical protein n=1 Tax=Prosthecobacter sp. TaxID=1965333 RepID=UPI0025D8B7EF|nr:hypothetical protein [Prosthecobacter sp.]MCF7785147.1 hypothetical protein [Prosthecobacter sp.]